MTLTMETPDGVGRFVPQLYESPLCTLAHQMKTKASRVSSLLPRWNLVPTLSKATMNVMVVENKSLARARQMWPSSPPWKPCDAHLVISLHKWYHECST